MIHVPGHVLSPFLVQQLTSRVRWAHLVSIRIQTGWTALAHSGMSRMPVYVVVRTPHNEAGALWIDGCFFFHFLTGLGRAKSHTHKSPTLPAPISVVPPHLFRRTTQFSSHTVKMLAVKEKLWRCLLGVSGTTTAGARTYAVGCCVFSSQGGTRVFSSPLYSSDFARCCTPRQLF